MCHSNLNKENNNTKKSSQALESMGDLIPGLPWVPKSANAQIP